MTSPIEERRAHKRYPWSENDGLIEVRLLLSQQQSDHSNELEIVDLSRGGLALVSPVEFAVGNTLHIRVSSSVNEVLELVCIVCNRQPQSSGKGFRYGVYFDYDTDPENEAAESLLTQLDNELERLGSITSSTGSC